MCWMTFSNGMETDSQSSIVHINQVHLKRVYNSIENDNLLKIIQSFT